MFFSPIIFSFYFLQAFYISSFNSKMISFSHTNSLSRSYQPGHNCLCKFSFLVIIENPFRYYFVALTALSHPDSQFLKKILSLCPANKKKGIFFQKGDWWSPVNSMRPPFFAASWLADFQTYQPSTLQINSINPHQENGAQIRKFFFFIFLLYILLLFN